MSRFVRRHRLGIARQALPALLILTAVLAMMLALPNHARGGGKKDPPPPPDEQISDSTDLDGKDGPSGGFEAIIACPSGDNPNAPDPGQVLIQSDDGGLVILQGNHDDDWFGASVAIAGDINPDPHEDFNGDGYADIIIGAPQEAPRGYAYVFYGPFTPGEILDPEDADMSFFPPEEATYNFGANVRQISDINCDGTPDIGIGGVQPAPPGGGGPIIVTYFVSGATGEAIYVAETNTPFNPWLEIVGDAEGDGDVDAIDIAIIDRNMGRISPRLTVRDGDFNHDGRITQADKNMALANMGADHFAVIDNCSNPCPTPPPPGFHCIEDCEGEFVLVPGNVWKFCDPIHCQAWCGFEIDGPFPSTQPLLTPALPVELHAVGGMTTHCDWEVLEGENRILILDPPGDTDTDVFRFMALTVGPVRVRAVNDICTYICEDEIEFNIAFDPDDLDGDGLTPQCEELIGSDPNDMYDPPANHDADGDGLTDVVECSLGTNPSVRDTDGDGLRDGWEHLHGLNPNSTNSNGNGILDRDEDSDGDGYTNLVEQYLGLNPAAADPPTLHSDEDGISDACEIELGSDPFDTTDPSDPNADFDHDGLTDVFEVCILGTNHLVADSDNDLLRDDWELDDGLNPLNPDTDGDGVPDFEDDSDLDGTTNLNERLLQAKPVEICPNVNYQWGCGQIINETHCVFTKLHLEALADGCAIDESFEWSGDSPKTTWPSDPTTSAIDIQLIGLGDVTPSVATDCCFSCHDEYTITSIWMDSDGDSLPDALELLLNLNPFSFDTDGDGTADPDEDFDGDGLSNEDEMEMGFWPDNDDSDGDGIEDGDENPAEGGFDEPGSGGISPPAECEGYGALGIDIMFIDGQPQSPTDPVYVRDGSTIQFHTVTAYGAHHWNVIWNSEMLEVLDLGDELKCLSPLWKVHCNDKGKAVISATDFDLPCVVTIDVICVGIDLDVDSDNNNGTDSPDRSECGEDCIEEDPALPGKILLANHGDADGDGIPDFADGFNLVPEFNDDDALSGLHFIPFVLEIEPGLFETHSTISLQYTASNPALVVQSNGTYGPTFAPAPGSLRLWTKDASEIRDKRSILDGGDYVPPSSQYTWQQLGLSDDNREITLYVESVAAASTLGGQTITCEAGDFSDKIRLSSIRTRFATVNEAGNFEDVQYPELSYPTPIISPSPSGMKFQNVRVSDDYSHILADLVLAGTVEDKAKNIKANQHGTTTQLGIQLNGSHILNGNGEPIVLPITWTANAGPGTPDQPYSYTGHFTATLEGIQIQPGYNTIHLTTANEFGFAGYASRGIEIKPIAPDDVSLAVEMEYYGSGEFFIELTSSIPGLPFYCNLFMPTGTPGEYEDLLGSHILVEPVNTDPVTADGFVARLTHEPMDIDQHIIWMSKVDDPVNTRFEGDDVIEEFERTNWKDYTFDILSESAISASTGGALSPFFVRVDGPLLIAPLLEQVQVGSELFKIVHYQDGLFLSRLTSTDPAAVVAVPIPWFLEGGGERREGIANFIDGFGAGLWDTGAEAVDGVSSLAQCAWYMMKNYNGIVFHYRSITGQPIILAEDAQRIRAAWGMAETLSTIAWQLVQANNDLVYAVLTNDEEQLAALGEQYQLVFEFAVEILESIEDEIAMLDDYEKGRIIGRIVGEIVLAVGPQVAVSAALKSAKVGQVVTKIATMSDDTIPPAVKAKVATLGSYIVEMATTKMCFVAGTLVHTSVGLVPIEQIKSGDLVLSRCEASGAQNYREVVNKVITHPDALYHLRLCVENGDELTITGTGEHPFFSVDSNEFIPLAKLRADERLLLSNGGTAFVTDIQIERGPPGHSFTTYNFEVADWHTYFVGDANGAGVWVHNAAGRPCERVFAIFERIKTKDNLVGDPIEAWKRTLHKFEGVNGGKKLDGGTLRSATLDVMRSTYNDIPTLPNGQIDFDKISFAKLSDAMSGNLVGPDMEVHHGATKQWSKRLWQIVNNQPIDVDPPAGLLDGMPGVVMPRKWHNFGQSGTDPDLPGLSSFHDILKGKLSKKPDQYVGPAGKQEILDNLQAAYEEFNQVYNNAAPDGWEFDVTKVWDASQQWLISQGIQ